jgi:hypothetical protein
VFSSTNTVSYLRLPRRSGLVIYAATFDATVAADLRACGVTLDGTEQAPEVAGLYASDPFDARTVSEIELHPAPTLPITVRYQRACGAPSPCARTTVETWPLTATPLGGAVALSDDTALAMTIHPRDTVPDHVLRLEWASKTIATSTLALNGGLAFVPFHGHAIVADFLGTAAEVDPELRVIARRSYIPLSAFAVGSDDSVLLATYTGCAGSFSVVRGAWTSTTGDMVTCVPLMVDHLAAERRDWSTYALQSELHVFSGTVAAPTLISAASDFTMVAIGPSSILGGPRLMDWSSLTRGATSWTNVPRPFGAEGRSALLTKKGAIIAGGDGGSLAIYDSGRSWCQIPLSTRMAVYRLALSPSGHTAFAALTSGTDGALLRLSLPPDL